MYIYNYVYITSTNINQLFIKKLITSLSSIILHQHLFVLKGMIRNDVLAAVS